MRIFLLFLALVAETFIFYIVFLTGTFAGAMVDPLHLQWFVTHPTPGSTRAFTPDGLLLMLALYLVILGVLALSRRSGRAFLVATGSFLLALCLGIYSKIGWHG
jgi:hypothetical protein